MKNVLKIGYGKQNRLPSLFFIRVLHASQNMNFIGFYKIIDSLLINHNCLTWIGRGVSTNRGVTIQTTLTDLHDQIVHGPQFLQVEIS
jgi:hypothetical protein